MATEGAWVLMESDGGDFRRLVTSDFLDTLQRLATRRHEDNPARAHKVEPNNLPRTATASEE
jgi:hypothetical protein